MSEKVFEGFNQDSQLDKSIGAGIEKLADMIDDITEYSQRDLLALSMIMTDKIMYKLVKFYIANKKHYKRKFSKELLEAFKCLTENSKSQSLLQKLFKLKGHQSNALF